MDQILHSRQDSARLLSISVRKIDHLLETKMLKAIKIGKRTLIALSELEKFARRGTDVKQIGGRREK